MIFLKICGILTLGLFGTYILKSIKYEYAFISVTVTIIVCYSIILKGNVSQTIGSIIKFSNETDISKYFAVLMKALGISCLTYITSEICRTAGEELLSNMAQIAGKFEILILCVPLASELINTAKELL